MEDWLQSQEAEVQLPVLAYAAGLGIELGAGAAGAIRRAVLLLATGGDPLRGLELDGRAVTALAADLDAPERRAALAEGLAALRPLAGPNVGAALDRLAVDLDLAWRAFAAGVLADSLGE